MKSLIPRTRLNTAILAIAISGALSSYADPPIPPPGPSVTVVNTLNNPVPVVQQGPVAISGNVTLSDTPNVNVANTPNVNVANTPNVNIANTAASPVLVKAVDSSTAEPVLGTGQIGVGTGSAGDVTLYTVPAGKRLVVEFVSARIQVAVGTKVLEGHLSKRLDKLLFLVPVFIGTDAKVAPQTDWYLISQPVKYYVEAGQELWASFIESQAGSATGYYQFTGYLVDAP